MATINTTEQGETQGQTTGQRTAAEGVGSPISNEAYNVISALQSKLEGLEAYRKYSKDADAQLWQELTQAELQTVSKLVDRLEELVKAGRLRLQEPGKATH
ncbi:MAG TPA: hypothetical protein VM925_05585 [Labilithrix sp.]|nr:hypothetical protein [Labilithrix sp.]